MRYLLMLAFLWFSSLSMAGSKHHAEHAHHDEHNQAEFHDDHGVPSHEAHMHGLAELTLVIEGGELEIELKSPAANIVGFEHRAKSKQQIEIVEKARAVLASPEQVFTLQGGRCSQEQESVELAALVRQDEHTEHETHHSDETGHSEIWANYHYRCQEPDALKVVVVHLMAVFSGIETLKAQWVSPTLQGTADLTTQSNRIIIERSR